MKKSEKKNERIKADLSFLADTWKSKILAREKVGVFSGGTITPKRMANLDSLGEGPTEGVIRIGRKVCYEIVPFIRWLESRSVVIPPKEKSEPK